MSIELPPAGEAREKIIKGDPEGVAAFYLADISLDWSYLEGKKILDIGAGSADFARVAKKHGVNVVSRDKMTARAWEDRSLKPSKDVPFAAGDAMRLPFADGSFDIVVSHAAPPIVMTWRKERKEEATAVIREVKRVLKDGGEFRFGPGNMEHVFDNSELFTKDEELGLNESEKTRRIRQKSLEFLRGIESNIQDIDNPNKEYMRTGPDFYHFYSLKKISGAEPSRTHP